MEKAQTLPRTKRDKSPSPSSSSFSSLNKLGKGLKIRKKKKKYEITPAPPEDTKSELLDDAADDDDEETTLESKSHPSITFTKADSASFLENERNASEVPRSPKISPRSSAKGQSKTSIKKIVKGGKNVLQKLKGKNESAPVMVEVAPLDLGRTPVKKHENFAAAATDEADTSAFADDVREEDVTREEAEANDVDEMPPISVTVTVEKDEWSVTETCEKVRRRSKLDNQVSVYEEEEEQEEELNEQFAQEVGSENDSAFDPATPEPRITDEEMKLSVSQTSISNGGGGGGDQSQINYNKKSPSTIKKEILLSINSAKNRKISDPTNGGPKNDAYRKTSVQARNFSDKNELLFKILVIGELGTGKTSIIKRYVHQFFSQHYRATIGVDFALKVLQWDNDTMIRLQLWDIAGQERFGNMTRVYYKEAVGAFIVFDVTRVATFEAVVKWKQDLDSKVQLPDGEPIPCVLLANKCDQPKEGIINNQAKMDEFCRENQFLSWFDTSAKENINIEEAAHCLVTKIVQNDKKKQEKETTNGTGVINVADENGDMKKKKFCNAC